MASLPRSGLFGFLLLLAALDPSAASLATGLMQQQGHPGTAAQNQASANTDPAGDSIEARLKRITAALREQDPAATASAAEAAPSRPGSDQDLAWVGWGNGIGRVGWGNGGFGNGGFGNGGWGNGGFRNGGWGNGGGFRNGGFWNRW